jgi:hypothetical protein
MKLDVKIWFTSLAKCFLPVFCSERGMVIVKNVLARKLSQLSFLPRLATHRSVKLPVTLEH